MSSFATDYFGDDVSSISNSCDDLPRDVPRTISFASQTEMTSTASYPIPSQKIEIHPSLLESDKESSLKRLPPSMRSTKKALPLPTKSTSTIDTETTACSSTYTSVSTVKVRSYYDRDAIPKKCDRRATVSSTPSSRAQTGLVGTAKLSTAPSLPRRAECKPLENKNQQQLAMKSSSFYNECFFRGINAKEAEVAARDIEEQYNKWWVNTTHNSDNKRGKTATPSRDCSRDVSLRRLPTSTKISAALQDQEKLNACHELSTTKESRRLLIQTLLDSGGDTKNPLFLKYLDVLHSYYKATGHDVRWGQNQAQEDFYASRIDGTWHTISKPTYTECHGKNESNESLYTLGRMSFDVFQPKNLICSLQATKNVVNLPGRHINITNRPRTVPRSLLIDAKKAETTIRNYDVCVDFTIEPHQTRSGRKVQKEATSDCAEYVVKEPIRGSMMNYGYCMPDPDTPNRLTVWFSGGSLNIHDECTEGIEEWKKIFDDSNGNTNDFEDVLGTAKRLAAKFMLGLVVSNEIHSDGTIKYVLKKPIGGHGAVFLDMLYADDNLRIMKGQTGCIHVMTRRKLA